MSELKPCPFCGCEAVIEPYKARKGHECVIHCNGCLARVDSITYDAEVEAIEAVTKAWNRRTSDE